MLSKYDLRELSLLIDRIKQEATTLDTQENYSAMRLEELADSLEFIRCQLEKSYSRTRRSELGLYIAC